MYIQYFYEELSDEVSSDFQNFAAFCSPPDLFESRILNVKNTPLRLNKLKSTQRGEMQNKKRRPVDRNGNYVDSNLMVDVTSISCALTNS